MIDFASRVARGAENAAAVALHWIIA
jgi:hypothetical protein